MDDREGNQISKDEAVRRGTRRPPCRGRPGPRRRCGPGGGTRRSARAARPAPPPAGLDSRPRSSSSAVRRVVVPETGADLDRVAAAASLRNVRVAACGRRFYFALRNIHPARNLGARRPRRANSRHEQRRGSRLLWDQFFWGLPHYRLQPLAEAGPSWRPNPNELRRVRRRGHGGAVGRRARAAGVRAAAARRVGIGPPRFFRRRRAAVQAPSGRAARRPGRAVAAAARAAADDWRVVPRGRAELLSRRGDVPAALKRGRRPRLRRGFKRFVYRRFRRYGLQATIRRTGEVDLPCESAEKTLRGFRRGGRARRISSA